MRPRAAMPVLKLRGATDIESLAPPPLKTTAPVSPRKPPSEPDAHTMALVAPSVEVTKGAERPLEVTLQPVAIVGGLVAVIRKAVSVPVVGRRTTKVPALVR